MAGPTQHVRSAMFSAWQKAVAAELCRRKGFRGDCGFDMFGSHQLLASPPPEGERQNAVESHFCGEREGKEKWLLTQQGSQ